MSSNDDGLRPIDIDPHTRRLFPQDANLENFLETWDFYKKRLVVFLGAGASVGARSNSGDPLPHAFYLRDGLWRTFIARNNPEVTGDASTLSLDHAAALVERSAGRKALIDYLVSAFVTPNPLWQHAVLPFLRPIAIFTTNYDQLIEQGWDLHPSTSAIPRLRLYYRDETPDVANSIPLYKPHGTVQRAHGPVLEGGLVITQFDYIEILNDRRKALRRVLQDLGDVCLVFIGYSFQDLDIAAVLYSLRNPQSRRSVPWYAIFPRNDERVRGMYLERYGIRQINRTFLDFMADVDDKANFIPSNWKHTRVVEIPGLAPTARKAAGALESA